jgi:hypothetical protein
MRSETAARGDPLNSNRDETDHRGAFLQVSSGVVGLAGLEPAASSVLEIDGPALCYPAFALVVRLRRSYKDGVNSLSAAERGRTATRPGDDPSTWVH